MSKLGRVIPPGDKMSELLCNIEIIKEDEDGEKFDDGTDDGAKLYVARIESELLGPREIRSGDIMDLIDQITIELQEQFEE